MSASAVEREVFFPSPLMSQFPKELFVRPANIDRLEKIKASIQRLAEELILETEVAAKAVRYDLLAYVARLVELEDLALQYETERDAMLAKGQALRETKRRPGAKGKTGPQKSRAITERRDSGSMRINPSLDDQHPRKHGGGK